MNGTLFLLMDRVVFQSGDAYRTPKDDEIQAATFMDDGEVLVTYVEGDCDVFLPFVVL